MLGARLTIDSGRASSASSRLAWPVIPRPVASSVTVVRSDGTSGSEKGLELDLELRQRDVRRQSQFDRG